MTKKEEKSQKSWFRKHPILTILISLFLIGMVGSILENTEEAVKGSSLELNSQVNLKNIILPDDKIPSEYYLSDEEFNLSEAGFISGYKKALEKSGGFSGTAISIRFYKFSQESQTQSYYQKKVQEVKDARGYEEKTISSPFTCFAYQKNLGIYDQNEVICYKDNVVFSIKGVGTMYWYELEELFDLQKEHLLNQ